MSSIFTVAPDILVLYLEDGWIEPWRQELYEPQPGDEVINGRLMRNGVAAGFFTRDLFGTAFIAFPERRVGQPFDKSVLLNSRNYRIHSFGDINYFDYINPVNVYLKSKPVDFMARPTPYCGVGGYWVYLELEHPLQEGMTYQIDFWRIGALPGRGVFDFSTKSMVSEAIHVSQVGFYPGAPEKHAFLSLWMGSGGGKAYPEGLIFNVIDERNAIRYTGEVKLHWPYTRIETLTYGISKNFNYTDVYRMDFSSFNETGIFRIHIPGIGASIPFEIREGVWVDPFISVMKGFFAQRSGIAKGPPYTEFIAPRAFHPEDGFVVYHMDLTLLDTPAKGLNPDGMEMDRWKAIGLYGTDIVVPNAWGGYFDAGDWDSRVQHLTATSLQLELLMTAPEFFGGLHLNIPESGNDIPDILSEALWNIDHYKRMQTYEGGIRGGIEFESYPLHGETSWTNSMRAYAYAPDHWSAYIYAAVTARAAYVMEKFGWGEAEPYRQSALRAFEWAEAEYAAWLTPERRQYVSFDILDIINADRAMAAIELYRLTGEVNYHEIFLSIYYVNYIMFRDPQAARPSSVYLELPEYMRDEEVFNRIFDSMVENADWIADFANSNSFGIVNSHRWATMRWGDYSAPDNIITLVQAHRHTQDERYLNAILGFAGFATGANSLNMSFTTEVGTNTPGRMLHVDSRFSGQPPPIGLTVFAAMDLELYADYWIYERIFANYMFPPISEWPNIDASTPVFPHVKHAEYMIHSTMSRTCFYFGYLAYISSLR